MQSFLNKIIFILSVFLVILLLYLGFGTGIHVFMQRVLFVFSVLILWLLYRVKDEENKISKIIYAFLTLVVTYCAYYYISGSGTDAILDKGIFGISEMDSHITWILIAVILYCTAKQVGYMLAFIGIFFLSFAYFGNYISGIWGHKGYDAMSISQYLGWGLGGIYASPIGAVVNFVGLYILFGELLDVFGAGKVFIDFSYRMTSRMKGGTAQAAVLSSAFMGTINGSAVANVMTTGTFTIPLMQKVGYSRKYAAAIEAVASTGGQIAPPVMGAVAFVMADMSGINYSIIAIAAVLPAILYYASLFFSTYLHACKLAFVNEEHLLSKRNIVELQHDEKKVLVHKAENVFIDSEKEKDQKSTFQKSLLFLPLICLIYLLLIEELSAQFAVLFAMALLLIIGFGQVIFLEKRFPLAEIKKVILSTAQTCILVSVACMTAGIIIGIVSMTGVGVQFAHVLLDFSNSFFFILCMVMLASLLLGMGLPSTAAYSMVALVCAPILIDFGVDLLTAHFFVFYFAIVSFITPPIGIAAYAAASIAKSSFYKTSIQAFLLGMAGFLIPFLFVYRPELLLQKGFFPALIAFIISLSALFMSSVTIEGFFIRKLSLIERLYTTTVAILMLLPFMYANSLGFIMLATLYIYLKKTKNNIIYHN